MPSPSVFHQAPVWQNQDSTSRLDQVFFPFFPFCLLGSVYSWVRGLQESKRHSVASPHQVGFKVYPEFEATHGDPF